MAAKKYMVSYYVLYACFALIILVFAAFFGYKYDNEENGLNAPYCTEGLMWLMYGMFFVTFLLAIWSVVKSIKVSMSSKGENVSGVPGGKIMAFSFIFMFLSLVIGLVCNLNEPDFVAADGNVTPGYLVTVTDMFLVSTYILLSATALAMLVNMTGVFAGAAVTELLGRWTDGGNLGLGFAMLSIVVLVALGLQLYFLRPKTDNVE